ncbi:hypothetical protein KHO97_03545 [Bacillus licheniformis]|uniref:hypothetical protein n=1 Tax=Bacillus licheniformis TaxID=1402 RepID=UPI0008C3EC68|nr:hypothetical protein [Bacillus licheniformis]MBT1249463.1 hypothetical protein [Bacillus licheniformis]MCY9236810.1 hypothetical protein [Bacillus licheniformis]MED1523893.1 hypothetical protein [Bacillus licheniformis]MED4930351.1 hypothetical protein [Bacillus licheniformis]OLO19343.1 hypothetical protein BKP29_0208635 [Bacillus licheniformis]
METSELVISKLKELLELTDSELEKMEAQDLALQKEVAEFLVKKDFIDEILFSDSYRNIFDLDDDSAAKKRAELDKKVYDLHQNQIQKINPQKRKLKAEKEIYESLLKRYTQQ